MSPDRIADGIARRRRHGEEALKDTAVGRPISAALAGARMRIAAPSIMRAPKGYFLKSGERVPSVTTIVGRFKGPHGLIHWAWQLGRDGKDYRDARENAADAGAMARAAIAGWAGGRTVTFEGPEDARVSAKRGFESFLAWADQAALEVTDADISLVSARHRFGGSFDAVRVSGVRAIVAWKATNALYPEHLIELAAYGRLWQEAHPRERIDAGYYLLRFHKTTAELVVHNWPDLDRAWEAFRHLRSLYELDKELKRSAARAQPAGQREPHGSRQAPAESVRRIAARSSESSEHSADPEGT